jgi:hypothetical protein
LVKREMMHSACVLVLEPPRTDTHSAVPDVKREGGENNEPANVHDPSASRLRAPGASRLRIGRLAGPKLIQESVEIPL